MLQTVVAPTVTTGDIDMKALFGLELSLHCAPKRDFGATGPPNSDNKPTLKKCLEDGIVTNARLRAQSPWKLYFPDEVVVVAQFKEIVGRRCIAPQKAALLAGDKFKADVAVVCKDAVVDDNLGDHVDAQHKKTSGKQKFMGMRSGAGFPKAALEEVILKPEDVLEVLGL